MILTKHILQPYSKYMIPTQKRTKIFTLPFFDKLTSRDVLYLEEDNAITVKCHGLVDNKHEEVIHVGDSVLQHNCEKKNRSATRSYTIEVSLSTPI